MKRFMFELHPISLPERTYDVCKYAGYVEYLMGKEREKRYLCHCFALFNDELTKIVERYLKQHGDCEYKIEPIYEDEFVDCNLPENESHYSTKNHENYE